MMTEQHWQAGVHHDGSALFVSNPRPALNETVTIKLRVPRSAPVEAVYLRSAPDGEGHSQAMERIVDESGAFDWWQAQMPITMPHNNYRFALLAAAGVYHYNALGIGRAETPDYHDFKLLADYDGPTWLDDRVFYQIFPDRFHNGDPALTVPEGAWTKREFSVQRREWGQPPLHYREAGNLDFYGGDLPGIQQKLDYLADLGVNAIYLNPIFPSHSNHRYNIDDFYTVDRYLGGEAALIDLSEAMHQRDMRLILDMTPNHTSQLHSWFTAAQQDASAATADFYTFYQRPDDYLCWLGVRSLPKLNYGSQKLREQIYRADDAVLRHWLKPPYNVDGWRLDVYNMTARQSSLQLLPEVGREMRRAIKSDFPQAYVFGENFFDATPYLQGDQLDGVMNYMGFNIPLWRWLNGYAHSTINPLHSIPAEALAEQTRHFRAAIPWVIARQQFNQLGSHDTMRILSIVEGDTRLVRLGITLLMAYVGVPCVYYGDEIGLPGGEDPDNRRTMPWDEADWDADLRDFYKRVIAIRKSSPALQHGGIQDLHAAGDLWAFQRQSPEQHIVVIGCREATASVTIPVWHGALPDGARLVDLLSGRELTVIDGAVDCGDLARGEVLLLEVR